MRRFLLFSFLLVTVCLHAEIRYVSKSGTSTPPYTSWAAASDSIQKCINFSNSGDTIYVGNGTYKEKIIMRPDLSLIGNGLDSCIIDTREFPQDPQIKAIGWADNCLLSGFSIYVSPPISKPGYGVWSYFSTFTRGTVINNKFVDGSIAIVSGNSSLIIKNNIIINFKKGIYLNDEHYYYQLVENNYVNFSETGLEIFKTRPVIKNNIFYNPKNYLNWGNAVIEKTVGDVDTVKFFNNIAITYNYDQFILTTTGRPYQFINNAILGSYKQGFCIVKNNVMINNLAIGGDRGFKYFPSTGTPSRIAYNNSFRNYINYDGFTPDSTNLSVDPMIVSEDSLHDFHLQMFSKMIDAGDPSILDVDGTRSDISPFGGPYGESYTYLDYPPRVPVITSAVNDSGRVRLGWKLNTETDFNSCLLYRDINPDFNADSTKLIAELTDTTYTDTVMLPVTKVYYKMRSKDNQGNISSASKEVAIIINSVTGEKETNLITDYELLQNYPNPFNPGTIIPYRLKMRGYVKLMIYDIKGELVSVLVNKEQEKGYYEAEFRAETKTSNDWLEKIASGIYLYRLEIKNGNNIPVYNEMKKMILIK